MFTRLRTTWLASGGALLLALSLSGVVAAAALVSAITAPPAETVDAPVVADTTLTFEDADGDGLDDDCDEEVVANEPVASAATAAVDLNADGVISTSEAAQSDRTGGTNCNHGGYVSTVAQATDEPAEETEETVDPEVVVECETEPAPVVEPVAEPVVEEPVDAAKNAHGKAVVAVAHDKDAVGGKNCNHGGAVSEAAKKDAEAKEAAREAREAAKAERAEKADKVKKAKTHGKPNR